jgi:hypothetical protein
MFTLYPLGSVGHDPDALWLSYDWNDSFDNREWRPCVEQFLGEVARLGYEVLPLHLPSFTPTEDFVEISYLVGGVRTSFMSDHLLSLITIQTEDSRVLRGVWEELGNKIGWVRA